MAEVVGVRFREIGKIYYFNPCGVEFKKGDRVIVETARGVECGSIAMQNTDVAEESIVQPLKTIIRKATDADVRATEENAEKEARAYEIAMKKIAEHKLDMKLVSVEYTFDNSKILFFYTAPTRVDFRELVKDLAGVFRVRIELRQIGVRDECKKLGGLSICGRPYCCSQFLNDFQPVSIKMAKEQGLAQNPAKFSGACGRLMCCLKYEHNAYEYLNRTTPSVGTPVKTPDGKGRITDVSLLTGRLKVRLDDSRDGTDAVYSLQDVKVLKQKPSAEEKKDAE